MSSYLYSLLPVGGDNIRLLRLLPNEDEAAPLQCELCNYSLQKSSSQTHLYEALSYVWGNPLKTLPIYVDRHEFPVTVNLYAALLHLRDCSFERIIWVDSICINQADTHEKERQIQLMAKIYGHANRVIVYLGEAADDSDQALEDIRIAAEDESTSSLNRKKDQKAILKLLQRPWFRRIWVLQEVATARRILIICGSTEMNGLAFCSGINKLELSYKAHPELQSLIRSVTYLIRGAIFRPKYAPILSEGLSLGELIDMYHTHEATVPNDKVYALLGMSSNDPIAAGLLPDYSVPWKTLLQRLIKFILSKEIRVETWDNKELVVIKGKGCILGQISSVEDGSTRSDKQCVTVVFNNTYWSLEYEREHGTRWILQASAKSIRPRDFVCLLQGASKPIIIRPCKDHFAVIIIAVTLQKNETTETSYRKRQEPLTSTKNFSRYFLLVWNLESSPDILQDQVGYEASVEIDNLVPGYLKTASSKVARFCDVVLALGDCKEYRGTETRAQKAIESCEKAFGKENPRTLALMDCLALIYKNQQQWTKAEDLFLQLIQTRKRVQGIYHQDTLSSIANLASTYVDKGYLGISVADRDVMTSLPDRIRDNLQVNEQDMVRAARSLSREIIALLLDLKGGNILVTKAVVKAAASNTENGKEIMSLLLDQLDANVQITKEAVKAAVENQGSGKEVMKLLLDQRGSEVQITEEVVKAAAKNKSKEMLKLLLDERGTEVKITEEVLKVAATNWTKEVMELLLDQRGADVHITEGLLKEIARCYFDRHEEALSLLLDQRGAEVQITEDVVKAAADNSDGKEVMSLLLGRYSNRIVATPRLVQQFARSFETSTMKILLTHYGDKVQITEELIVAAASNSHSSKEMISLLLGRHDTEVQITEEVAKAASGHGRTGMEVMSLLLGRHNNSIVVTPQLVQVFARSFDTSAWEILLKQYGDKVQITEEVVEAVVGNYYNSKKLMALLLDQRGAEVQITERVCMAVAEKTDDSKELMMLLFDQRGAEVQITEEVLKKIAQNFNGKELMALLLDQRGAEVRISEGVLKAIAGNIRGAELMTLLINQRDAEVQITEEVLKIVARNESHGKEMMSLLLDRCGAEFQITEKVVKAAAGNSAKDSSGGVMKLLLDQRGAEVQISEEVVKAAAGNPNKGVMELLLDRRGAEVQITEEVLKTAAGNTYCGRELLTLLLDRRGANVQITEEVLKVAVGSSSSGIIQLLLDRCGVEVQITQGVIITAARHSRIGVMEQLFDRCGAEVQITENVVKAAAENQFNGKDVMSLLLDRYGAEVQITEEVVKMAAENRYNGKEVISLLFERCDAKVQISEKGGHPSILQRRSSTEAA